MNINELNKQEMFEKIFKEHMKVETYSKSIESLFSIRSKSKIDFAPYYQRNYVWDSHKATYFIESILMGTEIPPLIFFNSKDSIEVIDGRQRYETILRFMNGEFSLTNKGLNVLKQLKGFTWDSLSKKHRDIIDVFSDAKIRIIEFRLVNTPPLDVLLQDKVKKEIFSRYNSGITPLKKDEIDNAIYDNDDLSNFFKQHYQDNPRDKELVFKNFFKQPVNPVVDYPIAKIMSFTRRSLVLALYPINYYVRGTGRTNILSKLYEYFSDTNVENQQTVLNKYFEKIEFLNKVRIYSKEKDFDNNRLALECFLWGLHILDLEDIEYVDSDEFISEIASHIHENISYYTLVDYNFSSEIMTRFLSTSEFLSKRFQISFDKYITADEETKKKIKEFSKPEESSTRLAELESLRLSKPEPVNNSIDDIIRVMTRRRYMIRPSYQRKEVININKASAIIESILLGIKLPPIFVFKRTDGINEVIDGQQRLLTLLGFIGEDYLDENNKLSSSKNHKFKLRKLRILKELNGSSFTDLTEEERDKILDFQIYVVEIDAIQNPYFDPVDLFIRLNDKPYPIRENSFEMWNSWANVEIISEIKQLKKSVDEWFFIKQIKKANDRDRMENEELLTSLSYIEYYRDSSSFPKTIDVYQKTDRMNSRISTKGRISALMLNITEDEDARKKFKKAIKDVKNNIKKIKFVLIDRDVKKEDLADFLKSELDYVFSGGNVHKGFRRRIQDFYFLWILLEKLNFEMVKFHRLAIKKEVIEIIRFIKNIPEELQENNLGYKQYLNAVNSFHKKYKKAKRTIKLNEEEKLKLIKTQRNQSSLSEAPIFLGDEIEVDHIEPLSIGGDDKMENLGIAHKKENRQKGSKLN